MQKKTENLFSVLGMAGVLGFEPRKCQIQSLMPYRLAIPQCGYLYYTIGYFFTSVFSCKAPVFLRFRSDRFNRLKLMEIHVLFTLGCHNYR